MSSTHASAWASKVRVSLAGNIWAANGIGAVLAEQGHFQAANDIFLQVQESAASTEGFLQVKWRCPTVALAAKPHFFKAMGIAHGIVQMQSRTNSCMHRKTYPGFDVRRAPTTAVPVWHQPDQRRMHHRYQMCG